MPSRMSSAGNCGICMSPVTMSVLAGRDPRSRRCRVRRPARSRAFTSGLRDRAPVQRPRGWPTRDRALRPGPAERCAVALLGGSALEPRPPRPPLTFGRSEPLAAPTEQTLPQGCAFVSPESFVLAAARRGDPVDVVLRVLRRWSGGSGRRRMADIRVPGTRATLRIAHHVSVRRSSAACSKPAYAGRNPDRDHGRRERHAPDHGYGRVGVPGHPRSG
jgi:hypothetical protein